MQNIDEKQLREIVHRVVKDLDANAVSCNSTNHYGVFDSMDEAINASEKAQRTYMLCSMADREKYINALRETILDPANMEKMSRDAVAETGMGKYEYKLIKNRLAATKSPGPESLATEAFSGDGGLTLVEYCPFGVIGAITPATNPTETIICNSIGMLSGGNSVIFSPHPRAKKLSAWFVTILNQALVAAGAPDNLIATVREPSVETTNEMMSHPKVRMLVATGGPGIVKLVMSSGKKAIGAGAGNPPVVVDKTADIKKAAIDIVNGCAFDNNLPCIAEKEVVAVDSIADCLIQHMQENGAYLIKDATQIQALWDLVSNEKGGPAVNFVGKSATYILEKAGISIAASAQEPKVIIMETNADHPFVREEMMMPILPIVRARDVDTAIDLALEFENGNRHTAIMHSTDVDKLTKMAKLLQTTIFVKNAPSYAGIGVGGEGHATFTIAGPTGEGLTCAKSFCRMRRCVMSEALHIR
ncbi:MAG: aldehyde dehydrogenase EutE [Clostridiales Family XIII bacterium]|jgi:propionaldehyde dehydrogenase|nr:aldehyde dehydrogenase EutE [Clostridiales Family XIII bacterium]